MKENQIFGFQMLLYSWRPSHWCINYYCWTDIVKARVFSALRHNSKHMSKFNSTFYERKIKFFGFPCCSTHKDLPIDASISSVELILTKLGWFQNFSKSQNTHQNSILTYKINFLGSHAVVHMMTFPLLHQLDNYYCRTDIDKARVISALR